MTDDRFFGRLVRRDAYTKKKDGTFYAYASYRSSFHHEIAEDCLCRCVYCDSHEDELGGRDAMEIDHFRPHSYTEFARLKDDPSNFHHSCGICNSLKSDWWESTDPKACHDGNLGFIDPFADLRSDYFKVESDGTLTAAKPPARYIIELLELNRPHAKKLRLRRLLKAELDLKMIKVLSELEAAKLRGEPSMDLMSEAVALVQLCQTCMCNL